jgi:hypothetical protein
MTLFSLTVLRLGLPCSYFPMTLLALLIFLYITITGILGMMGLKTLSFSKAINLLRVILTSSSGSWWCCKGLKPSKAQLKPF